MRKPKYSFLSFLILILLTLVSYQLMTAFVSAATPGMYVDPQSLTTSASFTIDINVTEVTDLYDWQFNLNYSTSILTATSITEGPMLKQDVVALYVSDSDDYVYKTYDADPSSSVSSFDTGLARPYGVEYVNGFIYIVTYNTDDLWNFTTAGAAGSPAVWDMSGYVNYAYGLGWNGTHFLIADRGDKCVYFVDPSTPTVSAGSMTWTGASAPEGVTFDGTYYWVSDSGTAYKLDGAGNIQSSFAISGSNGITFDGTYLWTCSDDTTYKYSTTGGAALGSWSKPGTGSSEGLSVDASPRTTNYFNSISDANGWLNASSSIQGDVPGVTGNGTIATINFTIDSAGTTALDLWGTTLEAYNFTGDKTLDRISHVRYDGSVTTTGVPEFPLGVATEIALIGAVVYLWWRRRKGKLYKSPTHLSSTIR
ncbi:MAG: hypothetical protein JSV64_06725 [Candidatus Bathyarchaeota archaeon]|nr:MAG: hypothetical protein JSV64_06725 [Candidatus Bathyarchaeota archaeon]